MEDLERIDVDHEIGEGGQVLDGERVDDRAFLGRGDLHQAELGVVRALTQELGIDRHRGEPAGASAKRGQFLICGDVHLRPKLEITRTRHG